MLISKSPTLPRQICGRPEGRVKKIKAAFTGVSARHEEAKILMERAEELQRRWDKALASAVQNRENARGENENAHSDNENARFENESAHSDNENARARPRAGAGPYKGNEKAAENGGRVQWSREGVNEYGEKVYKTEEQLKDLTYAEKLELFKANFYMPGSPQYIGSRIRFVTKTGAYFAEIDRQTQRENIKKNNPGRLNQSDKAKINIGAAGDFVTLLENAQIGKENVPLKNNNNDAKKGVSNLDYFLKNVEIDGKRYKVIINIRKTVNGKYVYEVKLSPIKKNSSFSSQPGEARRQPARQEPLHRSSEKKISQPASDVKVQKSERDNSVSNRELLREAAEREGASEVRRGTAGGRRPPTQAYSPLLADPKRAFGSKAADSKIAAAAER